jgi:hypothetical protein
MHICNVQMQCTVVKYNCNADKQRKELLPQAHNKVLRPMPALMVHHKHTRVCSAQSYTWRQAVTALIQ